MARSVSISKFYVYTLARPDGRVFYVGKGIGGRLNDHEREAKRGCACHKCKIIRKVWRADGTIIKSADRTIGEAIAVMMVGRKLPVTFAAAAIYDYEYRIRRKEWSAQRLDDAARETEEP